MRQKKFWFRMSGILAVLAMAVVLPTGAVAASKYKILHEFKNDPDGATPRAGLTFDGAGNLYGATSEGGTSPTGCGGVGCGTVFKLTPHADGTWTQGVLYSFTGGTDGGSPVGGVIFDAAGNLYGTTYFGGNLSCPIIFAVPGCGTVFKLTPKVDGSWTERVLYSFTGGDGGLPGGDLIFDATGNLYGTTVYGGGTSCLEGCGTVFKLTPHADGRWTEGVLHRFAGGADGWFPPAGLIFDAAGNLYGTTQFGGNSNCQRPDGCGTVFKLKPNADGSWKKATLHRFRGPDGDLPVASLIFDQEGNLYGTTSRGGNLSGCDPHDGCGVVFKLKPNADGSWTGSVVHKFDNHPAANPIAGLALDVAGNLYGTTVAGGPVNGGVVFKLSPGPDGSLAYSVLHVFEGKPALAPLNGVLVLDKAGNLYGTTIACGSGYNCQGVVFEITP